MLYGCGLLGERRPQYMLVWTTPSTAGSQLAARSAGSHGHTPSEQRSACWVVMKSIYQMTFKPIWICRDAVAVESMRPAPGMGLPVWSKTVR